MGTKGHYTYSDVGVNKRLLEAADMFHTKYSSPGDCGLGAFMGERAHLDKVRSLDPEGNAFTDMHIKTVAVQQPPAANATPLPPAQPVASVPSTRRSALLNKKPEETPVTNAQIAELQAAIASLTVFTGMYAPTSKNRNTPPH
jgi:hypothetical protein